MLSTGMLQDVVTNRLDPRAESAQWLAGIVGENPSKFAKSPSIWNPVLQGLDSDAFYSPFDVEAKQLAGFVEAARQEERLKGFSVTMPYKVSIMPFLDEVDPKAGSIGAVNVVVRTSHGKLIGANTDGSGAIASLTTSLTGAVAPYFQTLAGCDALLIGAGGAGKAVAWYLADAIGTGRLYIATRDRRSGGALCQAIRDTGSSAVWIEETAMQEVAPSVQLLVNATTKGQSGIRTLPGGRITCLEPYSALAPANPASFPAADATDPAKFHMAWARASRTDLLVNLDRSAQLMAAIPTSVSFMDIVYSPFESALLQQARLSGHRTLNGKGMNICQAADALFHWVFREWLTRKGLATPAMYQDIVERMCAVW